MIKFCHQCQQMNTGGKLLKSGAELYPVQIPSTAWFQICTDLIGPMNKVIEGKKYMLTAIDCMTKYVEADLSKKKTRKRSS